MTSDRLFYLSANNRITSAEVVVATTMRRPGRKPDYSVPTTKAAGCSVTSD
jgi:hypothetical protein